jgi:hypothetical protein
MRSFFEGVGAGDTCGIWDLAPESGGANPRAVAKPL